MTNNPIDYSLIRCSHFGSCGGCFSQNIPYNEQLLTKEEVVRKLFEGIEGTYFPILPCEEPWHYRNKMEFSFSQSRKGEKFLGLMMRGKRGRVTNLSECHLTSSWFIEVLKAVYTWWISSSTDAYYPHTDTGTLRTLILREGKRTGEKMIVLTISGHPEFTLSEDAIRLFQETVLNTCLPHSLILRRQVTQRGVPTFFLETVLYGREYIYEELRGEEGKAFRFKIRPSSFFQPNSTQSEKLYAHAMRWAQLDKEDILFDLYCGTGTLGIFASNLVKKVFGIELNPDAVRDGNDNIALNEVKNMEILVGDVGEESALKERPTAVIVDPPRAGLSPKAVKYLISLASKKIIYISCNPKTQVENVKELRQQGYEVIAIQPVDQFPHTPHIENIVALHKRV